jgi:hypothetical protein
VSAGLASSAGISTVQQPRRGGRLLLTAAPGGGDVQPALAAARLVQHPALLGHFAGGQLSSGNSGDGQLSGSSGGGSSSSGAESGGLGRYLAHAPLAAATVLQGAEGLRPAHSAAGFALDRPLLLVATRVAVLFAVGGLEAVLVLPLDATGGLQRRKKKEWRGGSSKRPSCTLSSAPEVEATRRLQTSAFHTVLAGSSTPPLCRGGGAVQQPGGVSLLAASGAGGAP